MTTKTNTVLKIEANIDAVIALRAIMEAAWRLDAVLEAIPEPATSDGKPHLVKILKESGGKATFALYDALNVLEARLGVELGPDEKSNQIGFSESFKKVTTIANEL